MSKKGEATREKILDTAQTLILNNGFSAVSIDRLIDSMDVTKGAFFHHFKNKNDLAFKLIERYAESDIDTMKENLARAEKLSSDPLQQYLIMIGLWEEYFSELEKPTPGCLMASYVYELQLFDEETRQIINNVFLTWRRELTKRLKKIAKENPPVKKIHLESLADQFLVLIEGAFILARSLHDPKIVTHQIHHYKTYIEMLFNSN